ncbi:LacI family DNA-binding transcriptional regulator [Gluconobacter kanchanaburiensis]|uniref:LacI family transcriptional regulator n=1 Tax=Gluconobacter kanchanaburiensis NBRC 103587 TaxID=1307948 RepID=A0A511B4A9_9PROT|nr:LacI family DNA-binding transcriptional regulator [Gluconobacter kanchanaburiensis]MBF0861620.1 LacI family DNA-binding transcriptional regulator [Gluconobacter kanchanaburiensis]GBR67103.1 transcriptional regulator [Gluconobacter kanchanaburiensis NBRC 103587]GEK95265.1 LacI family transcriptional regulator [Gluconobacter kanchanaburiensis NBRC 103587]
MTRQHDRRKVTLKDVAAQVGVSHTTVSNAYIRPGQLSAALRERILAAAQELGYTGPDPAAKQLATGRAGALGFLFSEDLPYAFSDPAILSVLNGVAKSCDDLETDLALISAGSNLRNRAAPVSLGNAAVDGYILYSVAPDSRCVLMAQQRNVPLVVVDQPRLSGVPYVGIDDRDSARRAAKTLLDLGHRHFGILSLKTAHDGYSGPLTAMRRANIAHSTIAMRLEGYLLALKEAGIAPEDVPTWEIPINSEEMGAEAVRHLLKQPRRPTAILAMSDRVAIGAMGAIRSLGLRVPKDVSIFGFDDIPAAQTHDLSTIRQPHERKGSEAVRLLGAGNGGENVILETELVLRGSIGTPA